VNAIYNAMEDVQIIRSLEFSEPSEWLPPATAQVTLMEAGSHHNVVPDTCRFVVDVRSNDVYNNERMLQILQEVCTSSLVPRSTRLRPSRLEEEHLLMRTIRALKLEPFGSSTMSDMALVPFPSVKMGPGQSSRSHTAGEFILLSELEAGIRGYCEFLEHLARRVGNLNTEP
jgi:acetylornithine deacetylase